MPKQSDIAGTVDGWQHAGGRLRRTFEFKSSADAIVFMVKASEKIELIDHHPEWQNVNRMLYVDLTTHNTGGVIQLDEELAQYLNALYAPLHEGVSDSVIVEHPG